MTENGTAGQKRKSASGPHAVEEPEARRRRMGTPYEEASIVPAGLESGASVTQRVEQSGTVSFGELLSIPDHHSSGDPPVHAGKSLPATGQNRASRPMLVPPPPIRPAVLKKTPGTAHKTPPTLIPVPVYARPPEHLRLGGLPSHNHRPQANLPSTANIGALPSADETNGPQSGRSRHKAPSALAADFMQNHAQCMLNIMYAHDEFVPRDKICATCVAAGRHNEPAIYRCRDCFGRPPSCKACLLQSHTYLPFHDIQEWASPGFFKRVSLLTLGLIVYLGHGGAPCPALGGQGVPLTLRVMHANGLHDVWVQPCCCEMAETSCRGPSTTAYQLWRSGLFPASFDRVYDVVSLSAINLFQSLVVKARVNASAFIATLRRCSIDVLMEEQKDPSRAFLRSIRYINFLQLLQRAGQAVPTPERPLPAGCLLTHCAACPHPEINMSPGWQNAPLKKKHIHAQISTHDGNFGLGQKDKPMDASDRPLTANAGAFVSYEPYKAQMMKVMNDLVPVGCHNFKAIEYKGLRSGIVSEFCRHELFLPNGTADLFKGERFRNVDFAMVSAHQHFIGLEVFYQVYDIACKWGVGFESHLLQDAEFYDAQFPGVRSRWPTMYTCIGKFHLPNHDKACRRRHDSHTFPGMGMFDGEGLERAWALEARHAASAVEMGIGMREDWLTWLFEMFNLDKVMSLPDRISKKFEQASHQHAIQSAALAELDAALASDPETAEHLSSWRTEVESWSATLLAGESPASNIRSPYMIEEDEGQGYTKAGVSTEPTAVPSAKQTYQLLRDKASVKSMDLTIGSGKSILQMLQVGLELEEAQHNLSDSSKPTEADTKATAAVARRIRSWQKWSHSSLVTVLQSELDEADEFENSEARTVVLDLPSALLSQLGVHSVTSPVVMDRALNDQLQPEDQSNTVRAVVDSPVFESLLDMEYRLRIGRAHDALRNLCRAVCLHGALNLRHSKVSGQNETTRSRSFITRAVEQKEAIRRYYNFNRQVLLSMKRDLPADLREVHAQDITPPKPDAFSERGSSRQKVSWIWNRRTNSGEDGEQIERDQVERWALEAQRVERNVQAARTERWHEEMELLLEEMRRTLRFFRWQVEKWEQHKNAATDAGVNAYCARQVHVHLTLLSKSEILFSPSIGPETVHAVLTGLNTDPNRFVTSL